TMISPVISSSRAQTAGSVALGTGNGSHFEDPATAATVRSLQNRAHSPGQTPVVRRTGALQPLQVQEKKTSPFATVLAALFLLCVIVYGVMKLRPEFQAARQRTPVANAANIPQTA